MKRRWWVVPFINVVPSLACAVHPAGDRVRDTFVCFCVGKFRLCIIIFIFFCAI